MTDTSNAPELLPCPFCGGEASYYEYTGQYQNAVRCKDIECAGRDGVWGDWIEDPATATRWNTRTAITPPQQAAKVLLGDRWRGYGNRNAMKSMWKYLHDETGRNPAPVSFYDGMLQAALRAIALDTITATCDNTREGE